MTSLTPLLITLLAGTSSPDAPAIADDAKPKVEFRWAETRPVTEVTGDRGVELSCMEGRAYLHLRPVLEWKDIVAARVQEPVGESDGALVLVELTPEAGKRLASASADNLDKPLVLMVDEKVAAAVVIKSKLSAGLVPFGPFVGGEAERVAEIIGKK